MGAKKKRAGVEWVGGVASIPTYVTGDGEPYRPEGLLWMSADGLILGAATLQPGEAIGAAAEHLRSTIERPMIGPAHAPARLRVASPGLAEVLHRAHPAIEIVCAPTPEIDAAMEAMRETFEAEGKDELLTHLSDGISADAVASFFQAAAGLFHAKPWEIVPGDQDLFCVNIEKLGLRDAAVSVIGQGGEFFGFIVFASLSAFDAFLDGAAAHSRGEEAPVPPHFALNFERGSELPSVLRDEIAAHGWKVAAPDAYPWIIAIDADRVTRPPAALELSIGEAISLALPRVLVEKEALSAAWYGGPPLERKLLVNTHEGVVEVAIRVPYASASAPEVRALRPPFDVLAGLHALAPDGGEIDPERRAELEDELMARFFDSPEGRKPLEVSAWQLLMDYAADDFGATIATLGPRELREIVFELFPRKVSIDSAKAGAIIEELRALYAFLKREFALEQADECLRVLGGDAVKKLSAALADSSKFGMAKSHFMSGGAAGFDMQSEEGFEAWVETVQPNLLATPKGFLTPGISVRPVEGGGSGEKAKKKQPRKAASKARKKKR